MQLIILDGPSCAGKTQLAQALQQQLLPQVWLNFSIDTVLYTLPETILQACNQDNHWEDIDIEAIMGGTLACVQSLLDTGNQVVFDIVITTPCRGQEIKSLFAKYEPFVVGLSAQWDCLVQRMQARGDRSLAEVQYGYKNAPQHLDYDLLLDSSQHSSDQLARTVMEALKTRL